MVSDSLANRIGFIVLGITNNFGYVVMLAAAFDLLKESTDHGHATSPSDHKNSTKYCNQHSTSTILLADIIPALVVKLSYPFLLVKLERNLKVITCASLSAITFIIIGYARRELLIFSGVICASLASGLGESVYLTNTPKYGNSSLSGWSMGTGAAGLLGATVYAVLRLLLPIQLIMLLMLIVPVAMLLAFFYVIRPITDDSEPLTNDQSSAEIPDDDDEERTLVSSAVGRANGYGSLEPNNQSNTSSREPSASVSLLEPFTTSEMVRYLPKLAKYFIPLLLVYFAEYFINQGLFELIYYPEINSLDHATQYSWFQVSYQLGVLISRSSLDLFKIRQLYVMALLQTFNLVVFLAHAAKLIHLPSFHLVIVLIIYEGLLGGFTYTNTYHRIKTEIPSERREFSIGVVTIADTLGIVAAGLAAIPVHEALCRLYDT